MAQRNTKMKKHKCNKCEETWSESEWEYKHIRVGKHSYCKKCYNEIFGKVMFELLSVHGLLPGFVIETDECDECEGRGQVEYATSHSWFEKCSACKGTGKKNAPHTA